MIFPWQQKQWQQLLNAKQQNRFPHALLLLGVQGMGKKQFAQSAVNMLLCTSLNERGENCLACHGCRLLQAGSHPDYLLIEPESTSQIIKIDQIREVVHFASETSSQGGYKVITIHPANAMNVNAANALLKTLEEPSANTILILIAHPYSRLPATISSRCQKIIFTKPSDKDALAWLQTQITEDAVNKKLLLNLADGAPLLARDMAHHEIMTWRQNLYQGLLLLNEKKINPIEFAAKWQDVDLLAVFNLLLSWLKDLLRVTLTRGAAELVNIDYHPAFLQLIHKVGQKQIVNYIEQTQKSYVHIVNSLNLNHQLVLEELFINWTRLCA